MAHASTHEIIPVATRDSTDVGLVHFFSMLSFHAKEGRFVCLCMSHFNAYTN